MASVLAQGHRELTLHVVADGVGPETLKILRRCDDPRLQVHEFPKGRGIAYAHRNVVLRAACAPYVAYMTDDDLWFPDHLERAVHELESGPHGLVAMRACHVKPPGRLDPYFFSFDWGRKRRSTLLRNWFMGSVECVHRREVFESVGYWNGDLYRFGDREFFNRVRTRGPGARYVDEVTVLRFYARHWDRRYGLRPPQADFLERIADTAFREQVRSAATTGRRGLSVRLEQWKDLLGFGLGQAPRFLRLVRELAATGARERET